MQNNITLATKRFDLPVSLAGWSNDSSLGCHLVQHIMEHRPNVIVELGSGTSTLLIAKCCELLGHRPVHIAVDHEQGYLDLTRESARLNGLEARVVFLHCPLGAVLGFKQPWYVDLPARLGDVAIDLLVVDGPPATAHRQARYPALPALSSMLSTDCMVLLDDFSRQDEQLIVKAWLDVYSDFTLTRVSEGHGVAVLSRKIPA